MAKKVTTIYIRDTDISLLIAEGRRVKKWARLPLEPGLVSQGVVRDEAQVADKVKELFKLEGIRTTQVIAGLSGLDSLYRLISLPLLPQAVVGEAVRHEARRVIPVPLDEIHLSYQLLPSAAGETRVFLATSPRNVADALLRTLKLAGVKPYLMDLAPLALCRTLNEPIAIIVNTRLDHFNIIVMADRIPQIIRRLSLRELAPLSERLPTIAEEFNRTVAFYNSSHPGKPIDSTVPVFVCGDLAEAPESWPSLVDQLNSPISPLPSPLESPEGFNPNEFMVNIGLALKELLPEAGEANFSIVNFNALPEVYQPRAVPMTQILTPIGIGIGIGLLILMGFLVQNRVAHTSVLRGQLATIENSIAQQREQIVTLQGQANQVAAQITPLEATTNNLNAMLTSLEGGRREVDRGLTQIASLVPADVDLTEINHSGNTITVSGIAPNEDKIFTYARDLRACGEFSSVIIFSSIEEVSEENGGTIKELHFELLLTP